MANLVLGAMLNLNLNRNLERSSDQTNHQTDLIFQRSWWFKGVTLAIACLLVTCLTMISAIAPSMAALPTKSAIKDPRIILRNALPIDSEILRDVQHTLEQMPRQANLKRWSNLKKDIETISQSLTQNQSQLIAEVSSDRQGLVTEHLASLTTALVPLQEAIAIKDRNNVKALSEKALDYVGLVEADFIQTFPFEVPAKYANLPQLKGRALVELSTEKGNATILVDGYNAPVNAGQFVDLVQKGFYDGLTFTRADENYYLQTGDPVGPSDGYIDPKTKKYRTVPIEVRLPDQKVPTYGKTFEEQGLSGTIPVLPFAAFGTVAMAHPNDDPNAGSSQFFIYLFESELTPAGLNLLDGNYTVFGYVTDGKETLDKLRLGDKVLSARVISGAENLTN
ncbi:MULTISPECIES: peptidylprolyl isomerase [Pseudanabaena]|uniref:peptidylprolyl isomerase n=1 Tax=Pseudanabaena TaxID=1152 RepID=UPI002479ADFF|nr:MULTISPECIES: peptidylprolyl isomerase [Pseudanabaena]MEA5485527.1 peptidylprolyl isomerase [Pseudanabaena sp. CCNP1317]WGS70667.1 peptidylprolyl isomerase [Pseudanabaena galeata CCNP1313]